MCPCMLSCVQLCATPWTEAHQAPLSMGFSRQEYWSGLPFPSPGGIFLTQGSNPCLLHLPHWQADSLSLDTWEAQTRSDLTLNPSSKERKKLEEAASECHCNEYTRLNLTGWTKSRCSMWKEQTLLGFQFCTMVEGSISHSLNSRH